MTGRAVNRTVCLAVACLVAWSGLVAEVQANGFQAGDRWVAIGDSITHGRRYHSFLYLFYATRHPDREFSMANCGISGDSAGGAVQRFSWDIGVHHPTVATIMLGMNDVGRGLYAPGQTGPEVEQRREQCIEGHVVNMTRLAELLTAEGCRILFITPSIYDQTGDITTENCYGVNDALAYCGRRVAALAPRFNAQVIDLHGPMTALNTALQVSDPRYTLVGPDRVHPGDVGQFIMAYLILRAMEADGTVATMGLDARVGRAVQQENCTITEVETSATGIRFTCLEKALPYPVLPAAREALDLVPFMTELNRETLAVSGLEEGEYAVAIDGEVVAKATASDLAEGIDLAGNPRSPMVRQAMRVMAAEEARHAIPARCLRTFAAQRHWLAGRNNDLDPNDFESMKTVLLADLEKKKGSSNFGYFKGQADLYIQNKPREAELQAELEQKTAAVWQLAQPLAHRFEIRPWSAADQAEWSDPAVPGFLDPMSWGFTSWTDTQPEITAARGILRIQAPRRQGKRDMLGLTRSWHIDINGTVDLKIRMRADAGSPFGVELMVDGALTRLISYARTSGEWETLSLALKGQRASSMTLILAEAGPDDVWNSNHAVYEFERIWVEKTGASGTKP